MENLTTSRSVSNNSIGLSYPNSSFIETGATTANGGTSNSKTTDSSNNATSSSSSKPGPLLTTLLAFRDHLDRDSFRDFVHECRNSRKLVLLVVFIALFFDNMLLTTVVPIIPEYLYEMDHPNETADFMNYVKLTNKQSIMQNAAANVNLHPVFAHDQGQGYENQSLASEPIRDMFNNKTSAVKPHPPHKAKASSASKSQQSSKSRVIRATPGQPAAEEGAPESPPPNEENKKDPRMAKWKKIQMNKLNAKVGFMFASKPFVQLIANPFIGPLTNKVGYSIPMFIGFIIMFISTLAFAFSDSYGFLFVARAVQGIGSSCSSVAGLGMLAERYPDDNERGNAMGIALGGLAMGVLVGPPFGGFFYEFFGKSVPFIILASLGVIDGILQLLILKPGVHAEVQEGSSIRVLVKDPYILAAAGAITFANMGIAMMEPSLPIWMMNTMNSEKWQLGAAFLPASIAYLIGTNLFGRIAYKIGRWLCGLVGLVIIGVSLIFVPMATSIYGLILPNSGLGFAIGMVDSAMMPTMGYLADIRHSSVYGSVYAIADVAFCLGFVLGPVLSGFIVSSIGFPWMLVIIATVCFAYAPLMLLLRNPPAKEEKMSLIMNEHSQSIKYVSYNQQRSNETSDNDDF